jgi:hypothetical protein
VNSQGWLRVRSRLARIRRATIPPDLAQRFPRVFYGGVMMKTSLNSVSTIGSANPAVTTPIAWNT